MKARFSLEHEVLQLFKEQNLLGKKILLAVSGGADSMALLASVTAICGPSKVGVVYYHHGPTQNQIQAEYREKASKFVQQICLDRGLTYFEERSDDELLSEEQMRDARYDFFKRIYLKNDYEVLVLAHHLDDLLETRLLRLIRGTGPEGLPSMSSLANTHGMAIARPLLKMTKKKLLSYLSEVELSFVEDPSNLENAHFRNWLRNVWLKQLEEHQPGGVQNIGNSLDKIAEALSSQVLHFSEKGINRQQWISLGESARKQQIASYLLHQIKVQFTAGNIQELAKLISRDQRVFQFEYLDLFWSIDAEFIQANHRGRKTAL